MMKRFLYTLLLLVIFVSLKAQIKATTWLLDTGNEQFNIYKHNNFNNDTLWVCDSIIYSTGNGEKYGKQEVLNRNILGNETASKYAMIFIPSGIYDYPYYDSITYFDNNEDIEMKTHSVFITSSNSWEASQLFHYQSMEIVKEEFYKYYSSSSQEFNGGYKNNYLFANNKPDTLFSYYLTNGNSWENQSYCKYYYDEFVNDTLQLYYSWVNNSYVISSKQRRIFNSGNLVHRYDFGWDSTNSNWQNETHMYYSYNNSGMEDTIIQQNWDHDLNDWRDEAVSLITYDENQRVLTYLNRFYDYSTHQIENYFLSTNIYENNNHTVIYQRWDNNEWQNDSKLFYSYIDDTKMDTMTSMDWNTSTNEWMPDIQTLTIYDFRLNAEQYIHMEYSDNQWQMIKIYDYYWSHFCPDFIITKATRELNTYPNPATNFVNISLPEHASTKNCIISIYSLSGELVEEINLINGKCVWHSSDEKSGIYFYSTDINNVRYSGKIMVK